MKYCFGCAQDIGNRKEQQDVSYVPDCGSADCGGNRLLTAVCDGMGGLPHGKEAAQIACESLVKTFCTHTDMNVSDALTSSVYAANNAVREFICSINELLECGTTLVAAAIENDALCWVSVGDSHIYHYSGDTLTQLNEDHTYGKLLDAAVERGVISKEIAESHYQRDAITSYIGIDKLKNISAGSLKLSAGDSILLCSDGLFKTLSEEEILLEYDKDPATWSRRLLDTTLAKHRKYQDNVTVVIVSLAE